MKKKQKKRSFIELQEKLIRERPEAHEEATHLANRVVLCKNVGKRVGRELVT